MGCDIHMHAFQKVGASYFCIDGRYVSHWDGEDLKYRHTWHERDYCLFSILADVRNNGSITPISEPRGLPEWAEVLKQDDIYDFGDHSQSWLSLDEVINWPGWQDTVNDERLVDEAGYEEFKRHGPAGMTQWCKGSSGPCYQSFQEAEFLASKERWKHIWVTAPKKLEEVEANFLRMCRYDLGFISKDFQHPTDIFLVFGFDS